jgi:serine/threonine protein kinase
MRFVHSRDVVHRNLTPDSILLDWDWTVRIADFGQSCTVDHHGWPSIDFRYCAPECYDGHFKQAGDVFSFGLILFEIVTGAPAFPQHLQKLEIACRVAVRKKRPDIPDFVLPPVAELISDCWVDDPDERPPFEEIVERLAAMEFNVIPNVNSVKMKKFVKGIEEWERAFQL